MVRDTSHKSWKSMGRKARAKREMEVLRGLGFSSDGRADFEIAKAKNRPPTYYQSARTQLLGRQPALIKQTHQVKNPETRQLNWRHKPTLLGLEVRNGRRPLEASRPYQSKEKKYMKAWNRLREPIQKGDLAEARRIVAEVDSCLD